MASNKIRALAKHLKVKVSEIEVSKYDDNIFEVDGQEWLVLTDSEADQVTKEAIRGSLWSFNYSFIRCHFRKGIDQSSSALEKSIQETQNRLCEGANEIIFGMIEDFDHFADDAIRSDGRGHFLSFYDGEEQEETIGKTMYFLYRVN